MMAWSDPDHDHERGQQAGNHNNTNVLNGQKLKAVHTYLVEEGGVFNGVSRNLA
jgi:hypothetical protein